MNDLIIFGLGVLTGTGLLMLTFHYLITMFANAPDINDSPCLICNHQQCRCGDMTGTDW